MAAQLVSPHLPLPSVLQTLLSVFPPTGRLSRRKPVHCHLQLHPSLVPSSPGSSRTNDSQVSSPAAEASESVSLILSGCFFSGQPSPRSAAISLSRPYFLSLAALRVTRVELGAQNTVPGHGFSAAAPRQETSLKALGKLTGLQDLTCDELLPGRGGSASKPPLGK